MPVSERRLYLVRHGETEGQSSIRYHGNNDVPLSDLGRVQVRGQIDRLRGVRFDAVVHSPLSRAEESARILCAGLDAPPPVVEVEPGLREVHFGQLEGLTEAEIAARLPDWYPTWKSGAATGYPDGETHAGFARRIAAAFDAVLARHVGTLLIVAHKGVIKRGVAHLVGLDEAQVRAFDLDLASVTVVRFDRAWTIENANLPAT